MYRCRLFERASIATLLCVIGCSSGDEGTLDDDSAELGAGGSADNGATGGTQAAGAGGTQVGTGGIGGGSGGLQQAAGGSEQGVGGAGSGGESASGGAENFGAGGSGGADGSGGREGSGGAAASACPDSSPVADADCDAVQQGCFYEDCEGEGRAVARCVDEKWFVQSAACQATTIDGCEPGQYLYTYESGTYSLECRANPCAPGLITEECISEVGCTFSFYVEEGASVRCIDQSCLELGCP